MYDKICKLNILNVYVHVWFTHTCSYMFNICHHQRKKVLHKKAAEGKRTECVSGVPSWSWSWSWCWCWCSGLDVCCWSAVWVWRLTIALQHLKESVETFTSFLSSLKEMREHLTNNTHSISILVSSEKLMWTKMTLNFLKIRFIDFMYF